MARPDLKLAAKHKQSKERSYFGAAWRSQYGKGYALKLDAGVKVILANGAEITGDTHYLDVFENEPEGEPKKAPRQTMQEVGDYPDPDDDIPF